MMAQNSSHPPPGPVPYSYPTAGGQAPMVFNTPQVQTQGAIRQRYQHKCVKGLAITLIVLGCLCFLAQFAEIFLTSVTGVTGTGIWSGIFFITTGAFGVVSSKERTTCWIVTFLVMSVIGAVLSIAPIAAGAAGWGITESFYYNYYRGSDAMTAGIAMNGIMLVAGIIIAILMIISSAFACHGLCPDTSSRGSLLVPGQVQYVTGPNGQQQMIIVPQNMPHAMPGSVQNPTSANQAMYPQPGQVNASAPACPPLLPAYDQHVNPPQYQEKVPVAH